MPGAGGMAGVVAPLLRSGRLRSKVSNVCGVCFNAFEGLPSFCWMLVGSRVCGVLGCWSPLLAFLPCHGARNVCQQLFVCIDSLQAGDCQIKT